MFRAGTHVPTRISAPAAARDFAIAHPYPLSSATPATNTRLPFRSIGNPDTRLLSLDSAAAFVINLSSLTDDDMKFLWKHCADAMWETLDSLGHAASLEFTPKTAEPGLITL
uniref:Uncharacterized protein n=1 Tax=Rhizophora mucronata TaxID=61149 RepID=A0A2P2LR78_RHIMU